MRIASWGQVFFALVLIAIGFMGLVRGDFAPVWEPVPKWLPAHVPLAYLTAVISVTCGAGLLWRPAAMLAARVLLICLVLWFMLFRFPVILHAPTVAVTYEGCGETLVVIAGVWVLYAWFADASAPGRPALAAGAAGLRIARVLYGLAMIAFGAAHFAYVKLTASLVPAWLPQHVAWVYLTGATYIAAGIAILTGICARLAATLSAVQMGVFTLLIWLPIVAAGTKDPSQWGEFMVSMALTAAGWLLADSYRPKVPGRSSAPVFA